MNGQSFFHLFPPIYCSVTSFLCRKYETSYACMGAGDSSNSFAWGKLEKERKIMEGLLYHPFQVGSRHQYM